MRSPILTLLLLAAIPATALPPTAASAADVQRKPDLADRAAGTYEGSVVADTRGGSQSGVAITVRRVSKNLVEVSSDYPRVPTVQIPLTMASTAILNSRGRRAKCPRLAQTDAAPMASPDHRRSCSPIQPAVPES
ncbi:hypothetical protein ACVWZA_004263 [Sphingomonas sp. UYAg733]